MLIVVVIGVVLLIAVVILARSLAGVAKDI